MTCTEMLNFHIVELELHVNVDYLSTYHVFTSDVIELDFRELSRAELDIYRAKPSWAELAIF